MLDIPESTLFPSFLDQYTAKAQCADPVTGSSLTPTQGAKYLEDNSSSLA